MRVQCAGDPAVRKFTGEPHEYLAGNSKGKYSIADIGTWSWVKSCDLSSVTEEQIAKFPHLKIWIARVIERPAVKIGISDKFSGK